jgi:transcriptional regulator with XRE-family HTH domain
MENIGDKVKLLREAKGWNYRKLAKEAGMSDRMVSLIEKNGQNCSLRILKNLSEALGVLPEFFIK